MDPLSLALWETSRHRSALSRALSEWSSLRAGIEDLETLEADPGKVRLLDQILFRFMKLQDAIGERLIPATLKVLSEPFEDWPMRDRLDRLERLGYLDATRWLTWREVRNRLAHEYPEQPSLRLANLDAAVDGARALCELSQRWEMMIQGRKPDPS